MYTSPLSRSEKSPAIPTRHAELCTSLPRDGPTSISTMNTGYSPPGDLCGAYPITRGPCVPSGAVFICIGCPGESPSSRNCFSRPVISRSSSGGGCSSAKVALAPSTQSAQSIITNDRISRFLLFEFRVAMLPAATLPRFSAQRYRGGQARRSRLFQRPRVLMRAGRYWRKMGR